MKVVCRLREYSGRYIQCHEIDPSKQLGLLKEQGLLLVAVRHRAMDEIIYWGIKMKWEFEGYTINTDKSLVSLNRVKEFLSDSYWASDRSKELIEKTLINSFCFGVYHEEVMVGFARVVSDYSTIAWICDLYIDRNHRRKGLGKKLIECILETSEFKNIRNSLVTRDAHGLYEQFGFERVESRFMTRKP